VLKIQSAAALALVLEAACFGQEPAGTDTTHPSAEPMRWASYTRITIDGHLPPNDTHIRTGPFLATLSLYSAAVVGLHLYQAHAWWSDDRGPFHLQEDWPVDLQVDKFGHFFGAYMLSYASREALLESGFTDAEAHPWGAAMGLAYQLYVEVEDGFSTKTKIPFIDWLVQSVDNFHFPAPAFQLAPVKRLYVLYPIRIHL
jgi:hypothetical protein